MHKDKYILLSFDVEEFDMPLEYGQYIPLDEQMTVGNEGLLALMETLQPFDVRATFFTTAAFAVQYPADIKELSRTHEIGSHTYHHTTFEPEDLLASRIALEKITSKNVNGLRMPRMRAVEMSAVRRAGYTYDSSINPTYLPGRYNNLRLPRTPYRQEGMLRFPVSVSPRLRIPLFWLAFKNFPYAVYRRLVNDVLDRDGCVCLYFHPWEFVNLDKYRIPGYAKKGAGPELRQRLARLLRDLEPLGHFVPMNEYIERCTQRFAPVSEQ